MHDDTAQYACRSAVLIDLFGCVKVTDRTRVARSAGNESACIPRHWASLSARGERCPFCPGGWGPASDGGSIQWSWAERFGVHSPWVHCGLFVTPVAAAPHAGLDPSPNSCSDELRAVLLRRTQ